MISFQMLAYGTVPTTATKLLPWSPSGTVVIKEISIVNDSESTITILLKLVSDTGSWATGVPIIPSVILAPHSSIQYGRLIPLTSNLNVYGTADVAGAHYYLSGVSA